MSELLTRVDHFVDTNAISVREPLNLMEDRGLRENLFTLLLCYNPLWLGCAMDAVGGRAARPGKYPPDEDAMRRQLRIRVLHPPEYVQPEDEARPGHAEGVRLQREQGALDAAHKFIIKCATRPPAHTSEPAVHVHSASIVRLQPRCAGARWR